MSRGVVLAMAERGRTLDVIGAACAEAGLELAVGEATGPCVLVGAIDRGLRKVTPAFAARAAGLGASVPLLLVCEDALVRSPMVLEDGRLTLVDRSATAPRVASLLRLLATERGAPPPPSPEHGVTSWRARRYWAGLASGRAGAPVCVEHDGEPTALVPLGTTQLSLDEMHAVARAAAAHVDLAEAAALATRAMGAPTGVLRLARKAGPRRAGRAGMEWRASWPVAAGGLWISSSDRLPPTYAVHTARRSESGVVVLDAAAGDLAVAVVDDPATLDADALVRAMRDGGPATLDAVVSAGALVLEVRA